MVGRHHRINGHEFEQAPGDGDGPGSLACCSPLGHKGLDTTERLNNSRYLTYNWGLPGDSKNLPTNIGDVGLIPGSGKSPAEGNGNPVFFPGKFHGQRSLVGYSPWGHRESYTT